jgi:hypothetical protein
VWVFTSSKDFMRNVLRTFYSLGLRAGKIVFIVKLYLFDELLDQPPYTVPLTNEESMLLQGAFSITEYSFHNEYKGV